MSKEFGRQFERFRTGNSLSKGNVARGIGCDRSYITIIELGSRNIAPEVAVHSAEKLQVPMTQRSRFYLRGVGYSEERIQAALDFPTSIRVYTCSPDGQEVSAGTYIKENMSGRFKSELELGRAAVIDGSNLSRLVRGERHILPSMVEKLIKTLQISPEDQAEFMLLIRGFPLQVAAEVLQNVDLKD